MLVAEHNASWAMIREKATDLLASIQRVPSLTPDATATEWSATAAAATVIAALLSDPAVPDKPVMSQPPLIPSHRVSAAYASPLPAANPSVNPMSNLMPNVTAQEPTNSLTVRELEILRLRVQDLTTQQIADKLIIAVGTVKAHNHNIFSKLGVNNRASAVTRAQALGLL